MVEITCKQCGAKRMVSPSRINQKYCNKKCFSLFLKKPPVSRNCLYCGKIFKVKYASIPNKYCSKKCQMESMWKKPVKIRCKECGILFEAKNRNCKLCIKCKQIKIKIYGSDYYKNKVNHKYKITCKQCGKTKKVPYISRNQPFCSKTCFSDSIRMDKVKIICQRCGEEKYVSASRKNMSFCSKQCADKNKITRIIKRCKYCNKTFTVVPSEIKRGGGKFCSPNCYSDYIRENPQSPQLHVAYNKRACKWFNQFDKTNNTLGQHAESENKKGEYRTLGYHLDYINHEHKMIIEWDEPYHWRNKKQIKKDIARQSKIMRQFPNYWFARLKQEDNPRIYSITDIQVIAFAQKQNNNEQCDGLASQSFQPSFAF